MRAAFRITMKEVREHRIRHDKLYEAACWLQIDKVIKRETLRWMGHAARMKGQAAKNCFVWMGIRRGPTKGILVQPRKVDEERAEGSPNTRNGLVQGGSEQRAQRQMAVAH